MVSDFQYSLPREMMTMTTKVSLDAQPLLYPEPALLICTYDADEKPNVMTAAWSVGKSFMTNR